MDKLKFEEAMHRLEELVEKLESGDLDLEASIQTFQEGINLSLFCQKELQNAQGRFQRLVESLNGDLVLSDLEEI